MRKGVNIPVKAEGAEQTVEQINRVGRATEKLGETTAEASRRGAHGVDKTSESLTKQGRLMDGLVGKIAGFVGIWKGIEAVVNALEKLTDRLRAIRDMQREIHTQSLSLLEAGQAFEVQTGTQGKQAEWAKFLSTVQKQGRLSSVGDALQVSTAFDIAMSPYGGALANQNMLLELAPSFGAANISGDAAAQFIKFSSMAGTKPTAAAYQDFFAKTMAGFRSSESTDLGSYLTGLQSGVTGAILQGATPENAIAMYSTALSVTKNEAAAATLTEQMTRLSSGAYPKPREALEKFAGVSWQSLDADQQFEVLLKYANSLPENQRVQILTEQGFSPELATGVSKIASPATLEKLERTRKTVWGASGRDVQKQVDAFKDSPLGKDRELEAKKGLDALQVQDEFGGWIQRIEEAEREVENLELRGKDSILMNTQQESYILAYQQMYDELEAIAQEGEAAGTPDGKKAARRARALQRDIRLSQGIIRPQVDDVIPVLRNIQGYRREVEMRRGPEYQTELEELRDVEVGGQKPNVTNYANCNFFLRPDPGARMRIEP